MVLREPLGFKAELPRMNAGTPTTNLDKYDSQPSLPESVSQQGQKEQDGCPRFANLPPHAAGAYLGRIRRCRAPQSHLLNSRKSGFG